MDLSYLDEIDFQPGASESEIEPDESRVADTAMPSGRSEFWAANMKYHYRRAFSELELLDTVGYPDFRFEHGHSYNFLTKGDVDAVSFIKLILRYQDITECIISSWCARLEDFKQLKLWVDKGSIGKADIYLGRRDLFSGRGEVLKFRDCIKDTPGITLSIFNNHTKITTGYGDSFQFVIQSSANINTNTRLEQTVISIDDQGYSFYRDFFKTVKSIV